MAARRSRTRTRTRVILAAIVALLVLAGLAVWRVSSGGGPGGGTADQAAAAVGNAGTCAGPPAVAPRELRAMWLTTVLNIDWPSQPGLPTDTVKAEYLAWLDLAQRLHHNAVYVHVRPSGDAFWPSQYAPWSEWLTGKRDGVSPGWDPMAWMVAETHARNLDFHAWFNPYRGTEPAPAGPGADLTALAPNNPLLAHPEWTIAYPVGKSSSRLYFDPGIPAARTFVEDAMLEAVARYDIDGVDFDDFFYPYPEAGQDFPDAASFAAYGQKFSNRGDWRRDNVNTMIREMSERIRAMKPWVVFGISPFGIWRNSATDPAGSATRGLQSYDEIYADTRTWVKQHWVDSIVPQLYWNIGFDRADYAVLLKWWSTLITGTGVQLYIGQGDYRIGDAGAWKDPAELSRQLALNAHYPVSGVVHFSAKSLRDDALGAVTLYRNTFNATPALPPTMARLPVTPPPTPTIANVRRDPNGAVTVTWRPGPGTPATSWALYRLDAGGAEAHLVAAVRATPGQQSTVDHVPAGAPAAQYCVSGLDRSWNEGRVSDAVTG